MHRTITATLAGRLGTVLLLTAAAATVLPATAGAWSTVPEDDSVRLAPLRTSSETATVSASATVTTVGALISPDVRVPLAMGISLIEGNTPQAGDDLDALDGFARRSGRMPASWSIWSDWGGANAAFPSRDLLRGLRQRGVRPVIFWQPTHPDVRLHPERYAYSRIVAGRWDAYLTAWANDAKAWGDRVIVRWAHEMNAPWFPWAIGKNGNTTSNYKAAWRHVVTLVRGIAPNVRFMWAPNAPCGDRCVAYTEIYPGDDHVQLVGFSSYNWSGDPSVSMVKMYARTMNSLMAVSDRRVVAAETGIKGPGPGRDRWLREGYAAVHAKWPRMKGIIYFDIDMTFGGHPVWRLVASDDSMDGYSELQRDPRFMGRM